MNENINLRLLRAVMVIKEGGSYAEHERALHGKDYKADKEANKNLEGRKGK